MYGDELTRFRFDRVELADVRHGDRAAGRVAVLGVEEFAPPVRPAAEFAHHPGLEQMIVDVVRVGIEEAAIVVILQKRIDAGRGVIGAKIEHIKWMIAIADVSPHLARQRSALHRGIEVRHLGRIGVQCFRLAHERRHAGSVGGS